VSASAPVSIVVPTYSRDEVLVATLRALLALEPAAAQIVVADQTPRHAEATERVLAALREEGRIDWLRLPAPSIPAAMNAGLLAAREAIVLFLDDDVAPSPGLVGAHAGAHAAGGAEIVAGQVLQPGEEPAPLVGDSFGFRSSLAQPVAEFMGGNFSISRPFARSIGGFDENFVGAAYRFEAELAARARSAGGRLVFSPAASVRHLRAARGGTRAWGDHLRTARPHHAVGEYYYLLVSEPRAGARWRRILARLVRAVRTRHHLLHPWWVPATLAAELRGLAWARRLRRVGPRRLGLAEGAGVG